MHKRCIEVIIYYSKINPRHPPSLPYLAGDAALHLGPAEVRMGGIGEAGEQQDEQLQNSEGCIHGHSHIGYIRSAYFYSDSLKLLPFLK